MQVELVRAPYVVARALAATVLVMTGATAAHTVAGGHLPGVPALVASGGLVLAASLLLLRGLVSWRLLLPGVALAQLGLHTVFSTLAPAGHAAHAGHAGGDAAPWSWQMLAAHAAGTALTALAWWLCDRVLRAVLVIARVPAAYAGARPARLSRSARPGGASLVHLVAAPRRGPPAALGSA